MPVGKAYPLPFVFSEVDADCLFAFKQARTFNIRNGVNDFVFVFVAGQSKKFVETDVADFNDFVQAVQRRPSFFSVGAGAFAFVEGRCVQPGFFSQSGRGQPVNFGQLINSFPDLFVFHFLSSKSKDSLTLSR